MGWPHVEEVLEKSHYLQKQHQPTSKSIVDGEYANASNINCSSFKPTVDP